MAKFFFIITPHLYTIGNSAEEIYLSLLKARKENRKVLFLTPFNFFYIFKRNIQCNNLIKLKTIYSISQSNFFVLTLRLIFSIIILFFRLIDLFLNKLFNIKNSFFRDFSICPRIGIYNLYNPYAGDISDIEKFTTRYNWRREINKTLNLSLQFNKNKKNIKKIFDRLEIYNKKYVCLHIRSSNTYNDPQEARERNVNISNFYPLINYLISLDYIVVRMGDSKMPLCESLNGLIDYAHSEYNSQYNDQCLIANCDFYIGHTSGIWGIAWLFEKKMLTVNNPSWHYSSPKKTDIDMYKIFIDKSKNQKLRISDWIQNHFDANHFTKILPSRYDPIENTADDLLQCMKNFIENKKLKSNEILNIKKIILSSASKYIKANNSLHPIMLYRFYLMAYLSNGNIDISFYKKNF